MTAIPHGTFYNCTHMDNVFIPNNIKTIGTNCYESCVYMTNLTIGSGVESFTYRTFSNNYRLLNISCKAVVPPSISSDVFHENSYNQGTLYVRKKSVQAYREADVWCNFQNIVGVDFPVDINGDGVMSIQDVTALIDLLLTDEPITDLEMDANGDGVVGIGDLTEIIDMLLCADL